MNKFVDNKTVITSFLVLALIYFPFSSTVDLHAQQRGNISITQATALPLVNAEGNQVKESTPNREAPMEERLE